MNVTDLIRHLEVVDRTLPVIAVTGDVARVYEARDLKSNERTILLAPEPIRELAYEGRRTDV